MSILLTLMAAALALVGNSSPVSVADLQLSCTGTATRSASIIGLGTRDTREAIGLRISGVASRIHVPRALMPFVHIGSDGDWWPLREVTVTDTEITGRFTLNFLDRPAVVIDRIAGSIAIDGLKETFRGTCVVADLAARKF